MIRMMIGVLIYVGVIFSFLVGNLVISEFWLIGIAGFGILIGWWGLISRCYRL